jgi:hypothetical protein
MMNDSSNHISPRWLKLKEAARYSAIGKDRLKQLAQAGEIVGFSDPDTKRGDWIFDRQSLDRYRLNQASYLEQKALAIMGK